MAATKTLTFTGTIEKLEAKTRPSFQQSRYGPASEKTDFYCAVCLKTDDGRTCYFDTPAVVQTCIFASIVAVVLYDTDRSPGAVWFVKEGKNAVATAGNPADVTLRPKYKVGDKVTISARVKAEKVSRVGNPYLVLNWVRLEEQPEENPLTPQQERWADGPEADGEWASDRDQS